MAEHLDKKGKVLLIVAGLAVVLALVVVAAVSRDSSDTPNAGDDTTSAQTQTGQKTEPEQSQTGQKTEQTQTGQETKPTQTLPALEYPLILEDGKLEIENLFQCDGMNPDCDYKEGKNVASLMLRNVSDAYLEEADITLTLVDGTVVRFHADDLPAGKTAMVFERSNASAEENAACADAVCTASWCGEIEVLPEDLPVSVDGVAVTVTNNTGHDISEVVIYCRCPMDEEYFGGIAYAYTINNLHANESATVEAEDCILGMTEVVRIAVKQE